MINRQQLLKDLQTLLKRIEADLLERSESTEVPEVPAALHAEYERAAKAERTAQNYEDWRTDTITQAAAAWVLSCVFVRFLEDNSLIDPPKISGPNERLARARDEYELYFRSHPQETDREYLLSIFEQLATLKGTKEIFGEHNAIRDLPNWISGDAAGELLKFFQTVDANSGVLVHDFTDPNWDTRFLGDLYQDLSEAARKKFALLQTPDFVEEFILDRTLEPALEEFGLVPNDSSSPRPASGRGAGGEGHSDFKMIDPACGSGHFLLGTFPRLLDRWQRKEPGTNVRELAQRTLNSIHGVDINPFAVAIAKFRLLLVAMKACDIRRLADAPAFHINVACGDSLLHGENRTSTGQRLMDFAEGATDEELYSHAYPGEDLQTVRALLKDGTYHCVVANPPYIVPKDRKLNDWYRKRFTACHRQYSLAVPFMQQIFQLAVHGGFTGQITANSFMKREFGKKLIETFFPTVDLTHVIDTSGAYIPGHGTPTTILFGRNRECVGSTIRTVLGIRGEPSTPEDPATGLVWTAIVESVDDGSIWQKRSGEKREPKSFAGVAPSRENFVSAGDFERALFHKHPWSIGGGGACELKELLEENNKETLSAQCREIGRTTHTGEDDVFYLPCNALLTRKIACVSIPLIDGEAVRDYQITPLLNTFFPYDKISGDPIESFSLHVTRYLWGYRSLLKQRKDFGQFIEARGLRWFDHSMFFPSRYSLPLSIAFAFVSTHNHFVLDRGGKVFKQSAPVVKLPPDSSELDHFGLLGLLNCSTACFWIRNGASDKGMSGGVVEEQFERFFMINCSFIARLPLPEGRPLGTAKHLDQLAQRLASLSPSSVVDGRAVFDLNGGAVVLDSQGCKPLVGIDPASAPASHESRSDDIGSSGPSRDTHANHANTANLTRNATAPPFNAIDDDVTRGLHPRLSNAIAPRLKAARFSWESIRRQMIAAQENLDWECYKLYQVFSFQFSLFSEEDLLASDDCPPLTLGQRAFEIVLARKIAAGETQTTWFERHGSTPITELPAEWPEDYKKLVERRIELIENDPNIRLIEQPEYKRRWNTEPWESQLERALREWLLLRLETYFDFDGRMSLVTSHSSLANDKGPMTSDTSKLSAFAPLREISFYSVAQLADAARRDPQFMEVGELYRNDPAFDVQALVEELVAAESVPHLPILRYKDSGLRKRAEWEKTWDLQREEDRLTQRRKDAKEKTEADLSALAPLREIPVPPKYTSADFISTGGARYWSLRGKLDVPKERWISFPHCEGPDGTLVICWAGYDHLQQAQAVSAYYVRVQTEFGGSDDPRLIPLLASLIELLPWLAQWHNEPNANFDGLRMGDYFEGFVNEEARGLEKTLDEIRAWVPPKKVAKAKPTKSKKRSVQAEVEADE
jgi:N-6 DNA Methylase